jgi:uncharacterized membrane protein
MLAVVNWWLFMLWKRSVESVLIFLECLVMHCPAKKMPITNFQQLCNTVTYYVWPHKCIKCSQLVTRTIHHHFAEINCALLIIAGACLCYGMAHVIKLPGCKRNFYLWEYAWISEDTIINWCCNIRFVKCAYWRTFVKHRWDLQLDLHSSMLPYYWKEAPSPWTYVHTLQIGANKTQRTEPLMFD